MKREYNTEKSQSIKVHVTTNMKDKLKVIASKRDMNVSEYIRYIITVAIEKDGE